MRIGNSKHDLESGRLWVGEDLYVNYTAMGPRPGACRVTHMASDYSILIASIIRLLLPSYWGHSFSGSHVSPKLKKLTQRYPWHTFEFPSQLGQTVPPPLHHQYLFVFDGLNQSLLHPTDDFARATREKTRMLFRHNKKSRRGLETAIRLGVVVECLRDIKFIMPDTTVER